MWALDRLTDYPGPRIPVREQRVLRIAALLDSLTSARHHLREPSTLDVVENLLLAMGVRSFQLAMKIPDPAPWSLGFESRLLRTHLARRWSLRARCQRSLRGNGTPARRERDERGSKARRRGPRLPRPRLRESVRVRRQRLPGGDYGQSAADPDGGGQYGRARDRGVIDRFWSLPSANRPEEPRPQPGQVEARSSPDARERDSARCREGVGGLACAGDHRAIRANCHHH
jgi:hypothetical protein